jgi:acetyl-CoA acetyltransferase
VLHSEIFVVAAVRTAIGSFGGALKDVPLSELATTALRAVLERSGVPAAEVGHVVMGNVIPTEPQDAYLGRVAAITAGIPRETPAFNVNRLCGSGLQAIISAAQTILLGDAEVAIGAGAPDLDVIESNEAFAAQACAVARELEFDSTKVNPNGSGISLGHPVGATGLSSSPRPSTSSSA